LLLCDFLGIGSLLVERLVPTAYMAVAPLDIEERCLVECLDGLSVTLFEGDRHERFDAWPPYESSRVRTVMLWHRRLDRHPAHRWLRNVILSATKSL
jgi:DNA-binding transcriptional LysR family regulator